MTQQTAPVTASDRAAREARAVACLTSLERELERLNDWLGRCEQPSTSLIYQQHFAQADIIWEALHLAHWFQEQQVIEHLKITLRSDCKLDGRSHFWVVKTLADRGASGSYDGLLLPGEAAWFLWLSYRAITGATGNESTSVSAGEPDLTVLPDDLPF